MPNNEIQVPVSSPETFEVVIQVDVQDSASIKTAEAWAVGQRGGVDVESGDPTYHNNSKYYAGMAGENAEAWAVGQRKGADVPSTDPAWHNNAKYYAEQARDELKAYTERAEAARDVAVAAAEDFGSGLSFKGSVNYASQLPASPTLGDEYLVLYSGSSGTNYIGQKYAWDGTVWRPIGNDLKLYRDADGDLCEED
jgi:hypothetical protein